jgi:hypothetical protein
LGSFGAVVSFGAGGFIGAVASFGAVASLVRWLRSAPDLVSRSPAYLMTLFHHIAKEHLSSPFLIMIGIGSRLVLRFL